MFRTYTLDPNIHITGLSLVPVEGFESVLLNECWLHCEREGAQFATDMVAHEIGGVVKRVNGDFTLMLQV